jgi:hypothetical protein
MSGKREHPVCRTAPRWLLAQLGKDCLAPLTGQDARALHAFVHLVELYSIADDAGQRHAVRAMVATLDAMQPKIKLLCKAAIPHVMDWADEDRIWRQIETERRTTCEEVP